MNTPGQPFPHNHAEQRVTMPARPGQELSCRQVLDFLDVYIEGGLDAPVRTSFEAHLSVCPSCVHYVDGYRKTMGLIADFAASSQDAQPPEDLIRAILASRPRGS